MSLKQFCDPLSFYLMLKPIPFPLPPPLRPHKPVIPALEDEELHSLPTVLEERSPFL